MVEVAVAEDHRLHLGRRRDSITALDTIESLRPRAVIAGHKRPDRADDPHIIDGLSIRFAESAGRRHSGPVAEPHPDTLLRAVILGRPTTSKEARKTHSAVHNVPGTSASRVAGRRLATRPGHRQMRARRAQ
jgi:hypothetical protein